MGCSRTTDRIDVAIGTLAARQYGVVSRDQLVSLGATSRQIQRRVSAGRLLPVHRCVFAVGHDAPRREARWMAAVLACGPGALLSHRSAAALWQLIDREGALPDVTAPTRRRTPGVAVHRGGLTGQDASAHRGITVTSPARTLVDLAHAVAADDLTRAVREAQFRGLFHIPSVRDALERRRSSALRELLANLAPTQSPLEDRLLRICTRHGLPAPVTQHHVAGSRVDFLWPAHRVVVETDGFEAHGTPAAFQHDRASTNRLQLAGYTVLRFTHADLTRRSAAVAAQIRAALAL
jgi:very-short-patch-repair endonuclease